MTEAEVNNKLEEIMGEEDKSSIRPKAKSKVHADTGLPIPNEIRQVSQNKTFVSLGLFGI